MQRLKRTPGYLQTPKVSGRWPILVTPLLGPSRLPSSQLLHPMCLAITDVLAKQAAATRLRLMLTSCSPCETFFPGEAAQCYLRPTFFKRKENKLSISGRFNLSLVVIWWCWSLSPPPRQGGAMSRETPKETSVLNARASNLKTDNNLVYIKINSSPGIYHLTLAPPSLELKIKKSPTMFSNH